MFDEVGSVHSAAYLLDNTESLVASSAHCLMLSYEASAAYFDPDLNLIHMLVNAHFNLVNGQRAKEGSI